MWDYIIHLGKNNENNAGFHNLEEGLFQIASQTCNILVQVNNNSTNIYNAGTSDAGPSTSSAFESEQSVVLLPPINEVKTLQRKSSSAERIQKTLSHYRRRLSTVLESQQGGDDGDFELWDQSQMYRNQHQNRQYKWSNGSILCKPSCIPITFILILIVLVVLLPLLDSQHDKSSAKYNSSLLASYCYDPCNIQIVESIPEGLEYPPGSPHFASTFEAWQTLIGIATSKITIGSFYWSLKSDEVYNHTSSWQGQQIFQQLLSAGVDRKIQIQIAQSAPTQVSPNIDTEILMKRKAAEVRSVNFPKLLGGGVLHTKIWVVDGKHFYIGSANMDWRSLTQVKELGVLVTNCSCLAKDLAKIWDVYWYLGENSIPPKWPDAYTTGINQEKPVQINFNNYYNFNTFFSSSPPPISAKGRTQDIDAIVHTIMQAEKFVHISVMDYFPLTLYTPKVKFWPVIDDALRKAALENKVSVKLLISHWNHSRPAEDYFLKSLTALSESYKGVDIQVRRFIVPATEDQAKIPFGRVNHNKYMVTDITAYIGTSNWSGDYFIDTAGVGFVATDPQHDRPEKVATIRAQLASIFERDWNSKYAIDQQKFEMIAYK